MSLVADLDEIRILDPACCGGCGSDLSGAPVRRVSRREVTDLRSPPPPWVTEYRLVTPGPARTARGSRPRTRPRSHPAGRSTGPRCWPGQRSCCARTTRPVGRAAVLMRSSLGVGRLDRCSARVSGPEPPV